MGDSASSLKDEIENPETIDPEIVMSRVEEREKRVRAGFWTKMTRVASKIPFTEDIVAAYYCAMDHKTPLHARATLLGVLVYFIMPIDFLPDFIIGLGYTDDMALLYAAFKTLSSNITPEHRKLAQEALDPQDSPTVEDLDEMDLKDVTPEKG